MLQFQGPAKLQQPKDSTLLTEIALQFLASNRLGKDLHVQQKNNCECLSQEYFCFFFVTPLMEMNSPY